MSAWSGGVEGVGIPACTEADTLSPCGQTHTCKNITLATTSLRPVTSSQSSLAENVVKYEVTFTLFAEPKRNKYGDIIEE